MTLEGTSSVFNYPMIGLQLRCKSDSKVEGAKYIYLLFLLYDSRMDVCVFISINMLVNMFNRAA